MINNTLKSILFFVFALCSFTIAAQDAPPSDGVFRLQNVATEKFLTASTASATVVTMSDSGESPNTHFKFVESGSFYNIDSEISGILRAPGAGGPGGAFVVVSTTKAAPASDTDKTWTIYHNETNDTYRFGSRTSGRFMYHNENGTVTHAVATETDNRSNWKLIPYVQTPVVVAPDEDVSTDLTCASSGEFQNDNTRDVDIPNSVNVGTADDRSCYSDYSEVDLYGKTWGVYNITDGSNHWDGTTLQPRIERSLARSNKTGIGSYARFTGVLRILEVGDGGSFNKDGSYLAQAKGKHSGGGGSADPAICLYRAHPVYGSGINAGKQVAFDIYAERILERGGEGSGREVVFLKRVNKNEEISFELEVGFRQDPNDASKKIHYCDAVIAGEAFNYNIPEPDKGLESGIRYGAYRVRGGRAQFRWANTTYEKKEVEEVVNIPDVTGKTYALKNVATGKFLTDAGASAKPVFMSDTNEAQNTHWRFVKSGDLFNIDSEVFGILRGPGANFTEGAYVVVSTGKASPASDNDKVWKIYYNESDDTYRFESSSKGRFMYYETDGKITHSVVSETDSRSKWQLVPINETLSVSDINLQSVSINLYPNPARNKFTISLKNLDNAHVKIYDVLGKIVFEKTTTDKVIEVNTNSRFKPGIYLVNVISKDNKVYHKKLVIQ
jgi:uncharacterized protein YifE (UPF0438 family)